MQKTSAAAHQVCERTLGEIHPDDAAYRRLRYALVRAGLDEVRVAYALRLSGRMEVMLLKPEATASASLVKWVSDACGVPVLRQQRGRVEHAGGFSSRRRAGPRNRVSRRCRSRSGEDVAGGQLCVRAFCQAARACSWRCRMEWAAESAPGRRATRRLS
ncbi:MAG: hypothetical protein ACLVB5_03795 [Christensenellales bacterium]